MGEPAKEPLGEPKIKFAPEEKGIKIDNIPRRGVQTGRYFTDYYGTWYEVAEKNGSFFWMIGEHRE